MCDDRIIWHSRTFCPICKLSNYKTVIKQDRYGLDISAVLCQYCGTIYFQTVLDESSLGIYYREYYHNIIPPRTVKGVSQSINFIKRYINSADSILDVGAGTGHFTKMAIDALNAKEAMIVEPNNAYANSSEFDVVSSIHDIPHDRRFDLTIVRHVIEHVYNPITFMQTLSKTSSGVFYIETFSLDQIGRYKSIQDFLPHFHLQTFNPFSLGLALSKASLITVGATPYIRALATRNVQNGARWTNDSILP